MSQDWTQVGIEGRSQTQDGTQPSSRRRMGGEAPQVWGWDAGSLGACRHRRSSPRPAQSRAWAPPGLEGTPVCRPGAASS